MKYLLYIIMLLSTPCFAIPQDAINVNGFYKMPFDITKPIGEAPSEWGKYAAASEKHLRLATAAKSNRALLAVVEKSAGCVAQIKRQGVIGVYRIAYVKNGFGKRSDEIAAFELTGFAPKAKRNIKYYCATPIGSSGRVVPF